MVSTKRLKSRTFFWLSTILITVSTILLYENVLALSLRLRQYVSITLSISEQAATWVIIVGSILIIYAVSKTISGKMKNPLSIFRRILPVR